MPRLFTALELPATISTSLSFLQSGIPGARWIEPGSFHITLRFIGDVEGHVAEEIAKSLEHIQGEPVRLELSRLDVFGGAKPHSLYAAVARNEELERLQKSMERALQQLGLAPDGRKFSPHVTLARLRGVNTNELAHYLSQYGGYSSLPFEVQKFSLFSARASTGGGPYVVEESFELAA